MTVADATPTQPAAPPSTKPLVLISYSHKDQKAAFLLADDLEKEKIKVWIDRSEIAVGDHFSHRIQEGIKGCTHLLVLLTNASAGSEWVDNEVAFARRNGKQILPARFEICEIPVNVSGRHYADFTASRKEGLKQIVDAIRHRREIRRLPLYWRLYYRFRTALIAGLVTILAGLAWALAPPSNTSAMLIQTKDPKVLRLHLANRGWWSSTVVGGFRLEFGDLPIFDASLDLANPRARLIVPARSTLDLDLVKRSGFVPERKLTAAQIAPLIGDKTITMEIDVKESNDPARGRAFHVRTITFPAEQIWMFLEAGLPNIFLGVAHAA